jgi:hypothetical protein
MVPDDDLSIPPGSRPVEAPSADLPLDPDLPLTLDEVEALATIPAGWGSNAFRVQSSHSSRRLVAVVTVLIAAAFVAVPVVMLQRGAGDPVPDAAHEALSVYGRAVDEGRPPSEVLSEDQTALLGLARRTTAPDGTVRLALLGDEVCWSLTVGAGTEPEPAPRAVCR